jgi:hypothetical protein
MPSPEILDESWNRWDGSAALASALKMTVVKRRRKPWLWTILVLLLAYFAFRLGCGRQAPPPRLAEPTVHATLDARNRYDLARDETRGGHTVERHIGKTDIELRERLEKEELSTDSTYSDQATAEMAVAAAIRENQSKIDRWLHRPGGHSNLVLDYDGNAPLGRSMHRGDKQSFPCSHAVAILKWVNPTEYYVLTSYPECWRAR